MDVAEMHENYYDEGEEQLIRVGEREKFTRCEFFLYVFSWCLSVLRHLPAHSDERRDREGRDPPDVPPGSRGEAEPGGR